MTNHPRREVGTLGPVDLGGKRAQCCLKALIGPAGHRSLSARIARSRSIARLVLDFTVPAGIRNKLAVVASEWLRAVRHPDWRDRYTRRADAVRLPTIQTARAALTLTIGNGGWQLRSAVDHPEAPPWLREIPAVAILRRV